MQCIRNLPNQYSVKLVLGQECTTWGISIIVVINAYVILRMPKLIGKYGEDINYHTYNHVNFLDLSRIINLFLIN